MRCRVPLYSAAPRCARRRDARCPDHAPRPPRPTGGSPGRLPRAARVTWGSVGWMRTRPTGSSRRSGHGRGKYRNVSSTWSVREALCSASTEDRCADSSADTKLTPRGTKNSKSSANNACIAGSSLLACSQGRSANRAQWRAVPYSRALGKARCIATTWSVWNGCRFTIASTSRPSLVRALTSPRVMSSNTASSR